MRPTSDQDETGMNVEVLESDRIYTLTEVCTICRMDENGVQALVDYGVVVFESSDEARFRQSQLDRLLRARRLQEDLELNHAGVALALDLLDTIARLERDIALLRR